MTGWALGWVKSADWTRTLGHRANQLRLTPHILCLPRVTDFKSYFDMWHFRQLLIWSFCYPTMNMSFVLFFGFFAAKIWVGLQYYNSHREYPSREQLSGYSDDKTCVSCCKTQHLKVPHHRNFHLKLTSHHCFIHVWTKTQDFPNRRSEVEREKANIEMLPQAPGSESDWTGPGQGLKENVHFLWLCANKWCCFMVVSKVDLFQFLNFSIIRAGCQDRESGPGSDLKPRNHHRHNT